LRLEARIDQALCDYDHGRWAVRSIAAVGTEEPENLMGWMSDPEAAPHGGESILDLRTRIGSLKGAQGGACGNTIGAGRGDHP
ncbi:histidine phosphatase family protein, partial [Rhizobium ruizarguesonis]